MFLIKFEQQAVCLWEKKKHVSKEENIIVTASTCFKGLVWAAFFHDDIVQIGIIPQIIFFLYVIIKLNKNIVCY